MHKLILTAAALALGVAPALAATNTPAGIDTGNTTPSQYNGGVGGQQMPGEQAQSSQQGLALRSHIKQELTKNGFTDVQVMPESFLVRAKDPEGHPVMMILNPDSVTAVTAIPANGGQGSQSAQNNAGSSGWSSGTTGTSAMNNSAHAGNAINSPNGNGTPTTR